MLKQLSTSTQFLKVDSGAEIKRYVSAKPRFSFRNRLQLAVSNKNMLTSSVLINLPSLGK